MYLGNCQKGFISGTLLHHTVQIKRNISIAGEALAFLTVYLALCHHLHDEVDPTGIDISRSKRVVGGDIVSLYRQHSDHCTGFDIKLGNHNVIR